MKKFISTVVHTLLVLALVGVAAVSAASLLPIPGAIEIKIVQSGSMEPAIHTGGVVVIQPTSAYAVGDVVTFGKDSKAQVPTTHRIVSERQEEDTTYFTTKGDANEEADANEVAHSEVIGRVLFTVPYVGYLIDFSRKPLGFIMLIVIPASLIILHELWGIFAELRKPKIKEHNKNSFSVSSREALRSRTRNSTRDTEPLIRYTRGSLMDDIYRPRIFHTLIINTPASPGTRAHPLLVPVLLLASVPMGFVFFNLGATSSYFNDREHSLGNVLTASILDFSVDADAPRAIALTIEGEGEEAGAGLVPFVATPGESLPFSYSIESEMTGGDSDFCSALQLIGSAPPFAYHGPLLSLATGTTTDKSPWNLAFYVPEGAVVLDGTICMVDLVYRGSQEGADVGGQYHDEERLSFLITYVEAPQLQLFSLPILEENTPPEDPLPEPVIDEALLELPAETPIEETVSEPEPEPQAEEPPSEPAV